MFFSDNVIIMSQKFFSLALKLKQLIKQSSLDQNLIIKFLNIPKETLDSWLGGFSLPDINQLIMLADFLKNQLLIFLKIKINLII